MTMWRCRPGSRTWPLVCNIGPDWPCNACTWALVVAPPLAMIVASWGHVAAWIPISLAIATVLTLLLLAWTDFSDPYVPQQTPADLARQRAELAEAGYEPHMHSTCSHCSVIRDLDTKHCYACDRCCVGIDHHCPWHGKCIGSVNIKPFYGFLWAVCALIVLFVVAVFVWFTSPMF